MPGKSGSVDIEKVSEYFLNLKRHKKDDKELDSAIEAHNRFSEEFRKYKEFYESNQTSYAGKPKAELERQNSKDPTNATEKLRKTIEDLRLENKNMQKQIEELKTRLSTLAGRKMVDGNPDIADLSDPFRPTQLAEKFRELYDEEWTHAYEELDKFLHDESKIIDTITYLLKNIVAFCEQVSAQQIKKIEMSLANNVGDPEVVLHKQVLHCKTPSEMDNPQKETAKKMIRELRRSMGTLSVRPIVQIFDVYLMKPLRQQKKLPTSSKDTDQFMAKAMELIWLMSIQNPPMYFRWQEENEKIDKDRFTFYTKRGDSVGQTVWPAVLLHKQGPLMSKGILQAK